ncbi:transcription factor RelB-like isoform X2 [Carcharodon carcharias]|uniref:transcription factor RelB-like isoform X2 n=1 Tax=Carcharodon carcharias TaxID=13397 RepID=UPI001B7E1E75|nr:transcription factor RelB-like isoform X2 [Carcharodon carcharias]
MKGKEQEQFPGRQGSTDGSGHGFGRCCLRSIGASGSIQQDQNFDLNVLNEFILKDLEEGESRNPQPCDFTDPQIGEIKNQLMNQTPGWAVSLPELIPMSTEPPQLVSRGTGPPQLVSRGTGPPQLVSRGTGPPQLVSRGTGPPQLVSRGTGPPQLVSRGAGPPQLVSRGAGPPQPVSRGAGPPQPVSRGAGPPQPVSRGKGPPQLVSRGTGPPQLVRDDRVQDTKRKVASRGGRRAESSRASSRLFPHPQPNVYVKEEMPKLVIVEQPKQRGMRFRYECEGRSAGSIPGENTTEQSKTLPTIQIQNWQGEVKVVVSLVTKDEPYKPHPHSLVGKDCQNGICEVTVSPKCNMKASFANLGIQCMKKKEIGKALDHRLKLGIDPFNVGDSARCSEDVDMNVVRLCFQAFIQDPPMVLTPVLSEPIYDKKATNTSELRICRLNKDNGMCTGGEELFLLCDKVQKEDIAVVFSKGNWEAKGVFSQTDVHRQIAIVFKTPPYCDIDIQEQVIVKLQLYRPSDKEYSDSFEFRYLPKIEDAYGIRSKCLRNFKFPSINSFIDPAAGRLKRTMENRDFQFSEDVAYNFPTEEDEFYSMNQGTKPWNCYSREYAATATATAAYTDSSLGEFQDAPYNQCYMKDEPAELTEYEFYCSTEELHICADAEALNSTFDANYNILTTSSDLSVAPAGGDINNYLGMEFSSGNEALSTILGSSIAMPSEQAGSKG